ncbi:MAG: tryptophan--tRNA ligase, partial [Desulfomonilaceae bacterium]
MRVLSGIQPSGALHLGNYLAMMKPMISYMDRSQLFVFIVNMHAMTSVTDGQKLAEGTLEAASDFLALGLDPDRSIFWVQSDVPEVVELSWILTCITPMGLLERCHSYKDKMAKGISPNHGLFAYPVLMAADILLYQSDVVPVGKDQKQHIEVARDIAIKFNSIYGETFVIPQGEINDKVATVPGVDGQKMSKSYGNTIEIFSDEKTLRKRVMSVKTDSSPVDQPKDPEKCNLFQIYRHFAPEDRVKEVSRMYIEGGASYG